MNIEILCITDLKSAKVVIALHKERNPKLKALVVPSHTWDLLWHQVIRGEGSIGSDYLRPWTAGKPPALIIGNVEIISGDER